MLYRQFFCIKNFMPTWAGLQNHCWGQDFFMSTLAVVVQSLSHVWLSATPWTAAHRLPCPSLSPGACSNSCPLSPWCHPTISSSVIPFSSWLQSFSVSGSFLMSQFFSSGGQSMSYTAAAAAAAKLLQSCLTLCDSIDGRLPRPWDSLGKNAGVGCHFLLQCMKVKSKSEVA